MEPQISDFYNEEPHMMKMIETMNDELSESQKENIILKKKIQLLEDNICGRPLVEKTIITVEEISKYALIEHEIKEHLADALENAFSYDRRELNIQYIFDHENEYIEILKSKLTNVSHEWCEYIVKNALEKYVVLLYVEQSWETNLFNTTELSNTIIHGIINSIVFGHAYVPWYYGAADTYVIQENNDPRIDDLYIIKCDTCQEYSSYRNFIKEYSDPDNNCCNCDTEDWVNDDFDY